ncbi:MAG: hypothetical protein UY51_C0003G0011 [Candidatus Jorgensenbacteria bacterium GW2011_GWB1_49_9]|uniref:Uncharacterized protein n=1 Tax=Candidatus Vogelbacteria bacterium GWA1_51_14 TaxID=1802435 RepID=A0A1G2QBI2_9BACT|nr:MAG: hypothetical protein UY51_C0003G0011 [Candidatus Jorgensenbacteria bacterium GW2011_GWB1_49_9]OHA57934.1 MAG: hypothetical protein A2114_02255 [Candidatus Vogelbacteria bacterium GWA1_51_14]
MPDTGRRVIVTESQVHQGLLKLRNKMEVTSRKTYKPSEEGAMWYLMAKYHFPHLLEELFPDYEDRINDTFTLVLKSGP